MAMLRYPLAQFAAASCLLVFLSPLTAAYGVQTGADDTETETWLESLIKLYQPASTDVGQQQTHYFTQEQIDYFKTLLNKRKAGTVNDDLKQEIVDHFFPKDSEENTTQEEPQTTTPADDSEEQVIQEQQTTTPVDDSEEDTTQQEQQTTTPADDSEEQVTQEQQTTKPADDSEEDTTQQEQQTTTPAESEEQSKQDSEEDTTQQVQQTTTPAESDEQSKQDSEEDTTQQEQQTTTPADDSEENTTQQEQYTAIPVDDSEEQTTQQEQQTTTPAEDSEEQTTKQEIQTTTPADDSEEQTTKQEIQTTTPADDSEEHTTQQEQQTTTPADDSEEDTTQEQQTTPADSDEQSKEDSEDTDDDDDDSHEKTTAPVIATTTVTPTESTTTVTPIESTTTVTPIESTTRVQPSLELCNNCVVHHGVGYAPFPGYCDAYIQCRFYGALPTSVDIRRCPAGNFWNQDKLTCDFEDNVKCTPVNGCPNHKAIPGDWAAYLINNGQNWTRVSCPEGRLYNSVTCGCTDKHGGDDKTQENCYDKKAILDDKTGYMQFTGNGWVRMACPATVGYNELTCRCTDTLATQASSNCPNMKPIPGDRSGFLQFTGVSWIPRSCAATLVYNPDFCICTYDTTNAVDNDDGNSKRGLCKSTLILNFDNNDATDSSTNKFWVNNTGVTFTDGKAYFNGKSRLTIPGLSNVEFGSTVYISIKYRHSSASSKQTLVANGDCQVRQSLAVCSGKDSVDFYAETKDQISVGKVTVPSDIGVWQGAVYALDNGNLVGSVGSKTIVQPVKGALDRRQRGLVIGGGGDCDNFHGIIDEVQVFLCKPEL